MILPLITMAYPPLNSTPLQGGAEPTGLVNRPIEARDSGRTSDFTKVYALNMNSWSWEQPIPIKSTDYLTEAISIASADVIRAQRKVEDNRFVVSRTGFIPNYASISRPCCR